MSEGIVHPGENQVDSRYDSTADTLKHIKRVNEMLIDAQVEYGRRAQVHDASKLVEPEKSGFDLHTPKLKGLKFGTPEYAQSLAEMGPTLEHHYRNNSHHPEFYENGVDGMDLFDVLEMLIDWKAAGERHESGGDIMKSIDINTMRFGLSPQLVNILKNTAQRFLIKSVI